MAKHGVATISTSTVGAGVRTCAADLPCARHQCVFDAAMAPAQESGLRENCTSRLSERAEAGRTLDLSRLYSDEAGEQSEESPLRRRLRGRSRRCRWSEGRGPRGIRTSKARTGPRARLACQRRWSVYGDLCRYPPEAGAVCGKAARTDLGGGRAMKRTSLPLPFPSTFMATSLHRLDAEVLGNRGDLLALLLGRLCELGRPANVEELAGGGEAVADHRIGRNDRLNIAAMRSRSSFDISGGPNRPTRPSNVS